MQLAFRQSVFDSAIRYHEKLDYDLAMISPKTPFIGFPESRSQDAHAIAIELIESLA